jgi:hypothetical protein
MACSAASRSSMLMARSGLCETYAHSNSSSTQQDKPQNRGLKVFLPSTQGSQQQDAQTAQHSQGTVLLQQMPAFNATHLPGKVARGAPPCNHNAGTESTPRPCRMPPPSTSPPPPLALRAVLPAGTAAPAHCS